MTKTIWTGVCAAIVGFVAAATTAQTPAPAQSSTSSAERRITVTGCLKEAPASAATTTASPTGTAGSAAPSTTGTTGSTADAAAAPKFVLTDAAPSAPAAAAASTSATPTTDPPPTAGAPTTAGATTTTAGAPAASASQTYRLIANPAALSPHVGKKLELTGTLVDQDGQPPAADSSAGAQPGGAALRVEAGKVIAASCSQ